MRTTRTTMTKAPLFLAVAALLAAGSAPAALGQSTADSAAIRATALDYIEGWYEGDAGRMERALHPQLAKRILMPEPGGPGKRFVPTSALELVQQTRRGGGSGTPEGEQRTDVTLLDVFNEAASVRVDAHAWIDYMHMARGADGEWRIVNVLWELRPRDEQGR